MGLLLHGLRTSRSESRTSCQTYVVPQFCTDCLADFQHLSLDPSPQNYTGDKLLRVLFQLHLRAIAREAEFGNFGGSLIANSKTSLTDAC